tara:strand:+ start:3594 stop:3947 length:354 start_codon:yes stop_codon:yes gene_type:complete
MDNKIKNILVEFIFEISCFFVLAFLMALLWEHSVILTSVYLVIFLFASIFWFKKDEILLFIIALLFFQIGEIIIVRSGAWTYNNPTYLGIPIWINLSWGFTAVIIKRLSITVSKAIK